MSRNTTVVICIVLLIAVFVGVRAHREGQEWDKFVAAHHCKPVDKIGGEPPVASKTAYLCDDGVVYFR